MGGLVVVLVDIIVFARGLCILWCNFRCINSIVLRSGINYICHQLCPIVSLSLPTTYLALFEFTAQLTPLAVLSMWTLIFVLESNKASHCGQAQLNPSGAIGGTDKNMHMSAIRTAL
jgi:hypothetical protein